MSSLRQLSISVDDKVTYKLSLDDLDLSFLPIDRCLSKFARRDSAIWSVGCEKDKQYTLLLPYNTDYCEIEVLAERKVNNENRDSISQEKDSINQKGDSISQPEAFISQDSILYQSYSYQSVFKSGDHDHDTLHCPICDIDVKNCFIQNHLQSDQHSKMLKLSKLASSRLQQYKASLLNKREEEANQTSKVYCNLCNTEVSSLTFHTSTYEHQILMKKTMLITEMINLYENGKCLIDYELKKVSINNEDSFNKDRIVDEILDEKDIEGIDEINAGVLAKGSLFYKFIGAVIFVTCIIFTVTYKYYSMYTQADICLPVESGRFNDDKNDQSTPECDSRNRTDSNDGDEQCCVDDSDYDTVHLLSLINQKQVLDCIWSLYFISLDNEIKYNASSIGDDDDKELFETFNKTVAVDVPLKQFDKAIPDQNGLNYFSMHIVAATPSQVKTQDKNYINDTKTNIIVFEDVNEAVIEVKHNNEPYCDICEVYPGVGNFNNHLLGKRHAAKLQKNHQKYVDTQTCNENSDQIVLRNKNGKKKKISHSKWEKSLPKKKQFGKID